MRSLHLACAALVSLAIPQLAAANSCPINTPLVETYEVPLGCPVIVHVRATHAASFTPSLIASRGGTPVDITGAVQQRGETLPIHFLEYDEQCTESIVTRDEPFVRYEIAMAGAQVGDITRAPDVLVVAAGPCPAPAPPVDYGCSDTGLCSLPDADGDGIPDAEEDGGCTAAPNPGSFLGAILLAIAIALGGSRRRQSA